MKIFSLNNFPGAHVGRPSLPRPPGRPRLPPQPPRPPRPGPGMGPGQGLKVCSGREGAEVQPVPTLVSADERKGRQTRGRFFLIEPFVENKYGWSLRFLGSFDVCLKKYFLSSYVCHAMLSYHCIILGFL